MIKRKIETEIEVRPNMRGGTGKVTIRHYFKPGDLTARTRLCAQLRLPPGTSIGTHEHTGEDEIYLIQSGRGKMVDGGQETAVEAGDAIVTGNGSAHSIRNDGTEDLVVTAVIILY